eukprot:g39219.t1
MMSWVMLVVLPSTDLNVPFRLAWASAVAKYNQPAPACSPSIYATVRPATTTAATTLVSSICSTLGISTSSSFLLHFQETTKQEGARAGGEEQQQTCLTPNLGSAAPTATSRILLIHSSGQRLKLGPLRRLAKRLAKTTTRLKNWNRLPKRLAKTTTRLKHWNRLPKAGDDGDKAKELQQAAQAPLPNRRAGRKAKEAGKEAGDDGDKAKELEQAAQAPLPKRRAGRKAEAAGKGKNAKAAGDNDVEEEKDEEVKNAKAAGDNGAEDDKDEEDVPTDMGFDACSDDWNVAEGTGIGGIDIVFFTTRTSFIFLLCCREGDCRKLHGRSGRVGEKQGTAREQVSGAAIRREDLRGRQLTAAVVSDNPPDKDFPCRAGQKGAEDGYRKGPSDSKDVKCSEPVREKEYLKMADMWRTAAVEAINICETLRLSKPGDYTKSALGFLEAVNVLGLHGDLRDKTLPYEEFVFHDFPRLGCLHRTLPKVDAKEWVKAGHRLKSPIMPGVGTMLGRRL